VTAADAAGSMYTLRRWYNKLFLYGSANPRRAHCYCVGTSKSGTHSIAALFRGPLRSDHEPERELVLKMILRRLQNTIGPEEWRRFIKERDKRLSLELDSSSLNYFLLDVLVETYEDAKFILTIRDCYSWLDSFINHQLARPTNKNWTRFKELRFRTDELTHAREEEIFKENGFYTLDGYLSYWAMHNRKVLEIVPPDRLLVVRTHEIAGQAGNIADFVGVPVSRLNSKRTHTYKARTKFNMLSKIEPDFLESKVRRHCRPIMDKYFPEIRKMSDILPERP
jgi:hypothetical protein